MKRKKWTEEEEQTLIQTYSSLLSSSSSTTSSSSSSANFLLLLLPSSRQKKFQPIADRVNSLHHLLRPHSFPFLWSWRGVSVKIHNMRHQYLHVKKKLSNSFDLDAALSLWPNFLRYREVFGDAELRNPHKLTPNGEDGDDIDDDDDEDDDDEEEEEKVVRVKRKRRRWREDEERRESEEMEWMERLLVMQMEHEKQAMQMHAEACQAQLQILGVLGRMVCQIIGPHGGGGGGGLLPGQVAAAENQQQQQREQEDNVSLVGNQNGMQ